MGSSPPSVMRKRTISLCSDAIKYIAMATMFLNHVAYVFLPRDTPLYDIFTYIGYFTAPVMCFFLVEGYRHTRSVRKYGQRLFLFAALSQPPFWLLFRQRRLNMIFTLLCCFLILVVLERVRDMQMRMLLCALLTLVTWVSDWAFVAPVCTYLLAVSWGNRRKMALGYGAVFLLNFYLKMSYYMEFSGGEGLYAASRAALSGLGILAAAVVTLFLYNGERIKRGKTFSKWFFYFFYPGHLFVLYLLEISLHKI